jgi:DNA-binding LacI/PurR family transcriptional regulator
MDTRARVQAAIDTPDKAAIARAAVHQIVARIAETPRERSASREIEAPCRLIVRESAPGLRA